MIDARNRFSGFTEDEQGVIHFGLQRVAKRILDRAAADDYAPELLTDAAGTFHLASTLAGELGEALGQSPVDADSLAVVAVTIAEGETPFAARMAAEVEAPASLGAHADVPVSRDEDEVTA